MSLVGLVLGTRSAGPLCLGGGVPISGGLYSEVQCIMGNGYMGTPPVDRMTDKIRMKTLPSHNFVGGG